MSQKMGYLVDLSTVQFDEASTSSWIQAMPLGKYDHPIYGSIEFTTDKVKEFADNVNNNVRGTELDIDYDHKSAGPEAAGWVKKAEARPDGLWIFVEWTKKAYEAIKEKAFKYFSPEFDDEWTHPKTGAKHKNVLFGGGITNRPFLKDILPLNLSEAFAETANNNKGGRIVDPDQLKEVASLLGLENDDITGDQIVGALKILKAQSSSNDDGANQDSTDAANGVDGESDNSSDAGAPAAVAASEMEALKQLSESNPAIKKLFEVVSAQGAQLKEARVDSTIKSLSDKAKEKGWGIPPTTESALREVLLGSDSQKLSDGVVQAFSKLLETGLVRLGEIGGERQNNSQDAADRFEKAISKIMEDRKVDYAEAAMLVAQEQPTLFSEYQDAAYAFAEN